MNTFPGNAIPQYPGPGHAPPPHMVYPGGVVPMGMQIPPPGMAPGVPGVPGVPPGMPVPMDPQTQAHVAMIQQQQMHAAQMAHQQMMMRQAAQPKKGKKQNVSRRELRLCPCNSADSPARRRPSPLTTHGSHGAPARHRAVR
jgi:hypothetical protein